MKMDLDCEQNWIVTKLKLSRVLLHVVQYRLKILTGTLRGTMIYVFLDFWTPNPAEHHSTETNLLSVHDHIIKAMSHQQVTCLTLLYLSAAFDTIDHSTLLERFSYWFGISSTALSWIKSYLLNRSFYVNIENSKSCVFQFLYGVPPGSVLGPLLFILYTTPLSTVISNSSANHQLYGDDTQLLLSFSALDFSHNITHLEHTVTNVSNWMSSNFLSFNPSKTEFLIFGLPQQLFQLN